MHLQQTYRRPGILTVLGVVSLIWSATALVGLVVGALVLVAVGGGSWLLGPVAGAVGTLVGLLMFGWMVASSLLSILLFRAGWKTLRDDPDGIRLHRLWAWISLALDALLVLVSGGSAITSWAAVFYAVGVLYVTGSPEVRAYFGLDGRYEKPAKPRGWDHDLT